MNSNSVCVDASVALLWLLADQHSIYADTLRSQWEMRGVKMVGPPMFHAEVSSSIRKQVYFKRLLPEEGDKLFSVYLDIPIRIVDTAEMYQKTWELAKKFNLSVCYDAQYLAVAELEDCELWTADRKLAGSLKKKANRVRWIGEFKGI